MTLAEQLDRALKQAGIPIDGVSIGLADDRSTWRVTPFSLQPQAQPVIDAFVQDDPAILMLGYEEQANRLDLDAALQALARLDFEERQKLTVQPGQTLRTAQECKARLKAIYLSLLAAG